MKLLFRFISLCLVAAPVAVFGNLGDNELKISQTYGNSTDEQKLSQSLVERHYRFNDMEIAVVFLNGTSQSETFKKTGGVPLTDDQIGKILEANANCLTWNPKASTAQNAREWVIDGPKPVASETSGDPAVFAVSGRTPPARGEKLIAVDMLQTDDSSSAPSAPPVLRRAVYKSAGTNNVLAVFTSAYENVSRRELPQRNPPLGPEK